ncbi:uncharacterized protein FSUBG_7385 [Fusarium subglutinans]|uniref:Uncharacterized protein n=1 Tax=Gibberella subglutinans TaxID=42677 RepID=A0A8H5PUC7_GIBSU|nr:uncharacterized protein FSUBG_7385 [Fusarium subglutinans]KAF5603162.1 hypothetical protein FSUBG_7385 [Fusarium subglutinans]
MHIYRTPTGEDLKLDTTSKFNVNLDGNWKHTTPDPARISGLASDDGVSYWNHYDLLGFILSLLKEDLDGAKKDNFFLPLTAVYGRWCAKIGGNGKTEKHPKPPTAEGITAMADKPRGVGAVPTVFQCTWMTAQDGVCFALGSSLAGFEKAGEKWKERLRTYRFDLLYGWNNIHTLTRETKVEGKKKEETWHFNNSPNRSVKGDAGTHFGNCGETYPFLHICRSLDVKAREDVNGLALKNFFLKNEVLEETYSPLEIHKKASEGSSALYLIPPCDNCEYLIQVAKGKKENFVYSPVESPTGSKEVPPS